MFEPTLSSAQLYHKKGSLKEWVSLFLLGEEGNNLNLLTLFEKHAATYELIQIPLNQLVRHLGPDRKNYEPEDRFNTTINNIIMRYQQEWDMPPLIVYEKRDICDGAHRFEALKQLNIDKYWVITTSYKKFAA